MAMYSKIEGNKKTQAPAPMDINAVLGKISQELRDKNYGWSPSGHDSGWNLGGRDTKTWEWSEQQVKPMSEIDQAVQDLMAIAKGRGKGRRLVNVTYAEKRAI